jgi:hypothetical protein
MLEIMPESKGKVLWVRASGKLTDADYKEVFIPRLEALIKEHGKIRLLFLMEEDFQGWELGAMWDDAKFGLQHLHDFEKIAVVGAPRWVEAAMKLFARLMDAEVKAVIREQLTEARAWIQPEANLESNYEKKS